MANPPKQVNFASAWQEARWLVHAHRARIVLGLTLMLISQLAGLAMPWCSKLLIDDVIGKGRHDLLIPIALASGGATLVQVITTFANTQVLGVAAQRAITDMRKRVQNHVSLLP